MNSLVVVAENSKPSPAGFIAVLNSRLPRPSKASGSKQAPAAAPFELPFRTQSKKETKSKRSFFSKALSNIGKKTTMNLPPGARPSPNRPPGFIDLTSSGDEDDGDDDVFFATPPERPVGGMNANGREIPSPGVGLQIQHRAAPPGLEFVPRPYAPPAAHLQGEALPQAAAAAAQPNGQDFNPNFNLGDYYIGEDNDEALARLLAAADDGGFQAEALPFAPPPPLEQHYNLNDPQTPGQQAVPPQPGRRNSVQETLDECLVNLANFFPGITHEYVVDIYNKVSKSSNRLIGYVLDKATKGADYPKAKTNKLKRKRELDPDEELVKKYSAAGRNVDAAALGFDKAHYKFVKDILSNEFSIIPMHFIEATLTMANSQIFPAYRVLDHAERNFNLAAPAYKQIQKARKSREDFNDIHVQRFIDNPSMQAEAPLRVESFKELQALRRLRAKEIAKVNAEKEAERAEEENTAKAVAEGTMSECGCCCDDFPINRMVHCSGDELHWFCRGCALRNAETAIGQSKYELLCMSTDGCTAGFSNDQRNQFLNENTKIALERSETESNLRMAGIENLASCPFCPYAAEYPPVEIDREFRCENPECEKVSCRLCSKESHIPKTCAEHEKENGLSIRRQVEEAMSAALIRTCNKCKTPFVKEEGCNKMTCTLKGCMNIQCYVCSKSCGYDHFNDERRGGKTGNCPLFESVEDRHIGEVEKAEKEALEKVLADHPEYTAEDLKIQMSSNVAQDDAARKARDVQRNGLGGGFGGGAGAAQVAALQARMAAARQGIYGAAGRLNGDRLAILGRLDDFGAGYRGFYHELGSPQVDGHHVNQEQREELAAGLEADLEAGVLNPLDRLAAGRQTAAQAARARARYADFNADPRHPHAGVIGEAEAFGLFIPPAAGIEAGADNVQPPVDRVAAIEPEPNAGVNFERQNVGDALDRFWGRGLDLRRDDDLANERILRFPGIDPHQAPRDAVAPGIIRRLPGGPEYVRRPEWDAVVHAGLERLEQNQSLALRRPPVGNDDDAAAIMQAPLPRLRRASRQAVVDKDANNINALVNAIPPPRASKNREYRQRFQIRPSPRDIPRRQDHEEDDADVIEEMVLGAQEAAVGPLQRRQRIFKVLDEVRRNEERERLQVMDRFMEVQARNEVAQPAPAPATPPPQRRRFSQIMEDLRAARLEANGDVPQPDQEARAAVRPWQAFIPAVAPLRAPDPNVPRLAARPGLPGARDDGQPLVPRRPAAAANPFRADPYRRALLRGALDVEFPPLVPRPAAAANASEPRPAARLNLPGHLDPANANRARHIRRGLVPGALDVENQPLVSPRPAATADVNKPRPAPKAQVPVAWIDRVGKDNDAGWMNSDEDEEYSLTALNK